MNSPVFVSTSKGYINLLLVRHVEILRETKSYRLWFDKEHSVDVPMVGVNDAIKLLLIPA